MKELIGEELFSQYFGPNGELNGFSLTGIQLNGDDAGVQDLESIITKIKEGNYHVWHLFVIRIKNRNKVLNEFNSHKVEFGIHYPVPIHLQPAAKFLGYKVGDFPVAENQSKKILTLPIHQDLRSSADKGEPLTYSKPDHEVSKLFQEIAEKIKQSFL